MIHITQGHEKSISLEIFLRSCLLLRPHQTQLLKLHCKRETLTDHLDWLDISSKITDDKLYFSQHEISLSLTDKIFQNPTMASLESALNEISQDDILVTLPTSKDQFNKGHAGHTEFFRSYFKDSNLAMTFYNGHSFTSLITDHIPLKKVTEKIHSDLIVDKLENTLCDLDKYFKKPQKVIFSGINPHAGEDGQLGDEEKHIYKAIAKLQTSYPSIDFLGPFSGDTLHNFSGSKNEYLYVYMHHDQGLAPFKQRNLFWGSNITFGLPFLRLSVDHGTAFELYGKKKAHFLGCYDVLLTALNLHES